MANELNLKKEPMLPTVIYENIAIIAIDKPSGIIVNRSDTTKGEKTIQDWVEEKWNAVNSGLTTDQESDFLKRSGIVHRLDKETSGILLVAKTPNAFLHLQRQFKERVVKKTYFALAHGVIVPEEGEINVPVGRLAFNRMRFGVVAGGREAVTKYKVIAVKHLLSNKKKEAFSFVALYPETGRTHQIRVHLKYLNHPIVADELYAGRKTAREDRKLLGRLFLHAAKISFVNPEDNMQITLESPLPADLENFYKQLVLR